MIGRFVWEECYEPRLRPLGGACRQHRRAVIPNEQGRVVAGGSAVPGCYVAGWIKRGPSGVIGTNKPDAVETIAALLEDADAGRLPAPSQPHPGAVPALLEERGVEVVTWRDWQALDAHECAAGAARGAPREKVTDTGEMLAVIRRARQDS